ncbi:lipase chaperone [Pseudomonas chengduensis]|uniref:lipase secretion chaperone n=1 Tax=Ectopseudomonas oleovorans TaxID=301 RepID=UPI00244BAC96|nr:lipase secretion chaperone [Pseudomonas chengduensis]MDH1681519.1 lipase chaperone [Pseudomonas chengduensis]
MAPSRPRPTIGGLVNYFHTIPWNLERDGAREHVASVAAFNDSEQRLLDEQRRERDWQQHYQAYRNELASLQGRGLSEADGEQLQRHLRERLFSSEDRHRVETYDAIAAKQPEPLAP